MDKGTSVMIAVALWAIALFLGLQTIHTYHYSPPLQSAQQEVHEEVVRVVGRVGVGVSEGFLVESEHGLRIVRYDRGSMFANQRQMPEYLTLYHGTSGRPAVRPVDAY